jgi:TatD DNase family protein
VPLDRTLIETDSPYLAPMPHRGKRNEAFLRPIGRREILAWRIAGDDRASDD